MSTPDLITIKARTPTGYIQEFRVSEILEIDGQPWAGRDDVASILINHEERLTALEAHNG